jgi:hypothetical protein
LIVLAAGPARAQFARASLSGQISSGFYTTRNRNLVDSTISFVPLTLDTSLAGYLGAPGFIDFDVRPSLTLGPAATEAGFTGANGVAATLNFLSHRDFPLQLTYENLQREDVYFGSLTQLSGIRSTNHNRIFSLIWQWRRPRLPQLTFDMGNSHLTAEPIMSLLPSVGSRSSHVALQIQDRRFGWTIDGILRQDHLISNLANPAESPGSSFTIDQTVRRYQATASRPLWKNSQFIVNGTVLNNHNIFDGHPFDQNTRSASAALNFGQGEKLQGGARVAYSDNLLGSAIQQAVAGLATGQPNGVPPTDLLLLTPVNVRLNNLSDSGHLRYKVFEDWSLLGAVRQDRVRVPKPLPTTPEADYLTGNAGLAYQHTYSWASLNAEYTRNLGRSIYGQQHGRFTGQNFSFSGHRGGVDDVEVGASYNYSNQRFVQTQPLTSLSQSGEVTLGKRVNRIGVVLHGSLGLQNSSYRTAVSDYHARGLTYRAIAEHRLIQASYSRNTGSGNTVEGLLANPESSVVNTALLAGTPLQVLESSRLGDTLNVHSNPWRRVEFTYLRLNGREILGGALTNRYAQTEFRAGHRFRQLLLEVGYVRYQQSLLTAFSYLYTRSRFYVRVSRSFEVF